MMSRVSLPALAVIQTSGCGGGLGGRQRRAKLLDQRRERVALRARAAQPRTCSRAMVGDEALARDRLQQVVDGAALERLDRVLVVGGDEHDLRARAALPRPRPRPRVRSAPACGCRGTRRRACARRSPRAPRRRPRRPRRPQRRAMPARSSCQQRVAKQLLVFGDDARDAAQAWRTCLRAGRGNRDRRGDARGKLATMSNAASAP